MKKLIIDTCKGKVKGEQIGDVSVWKGIPYAKAPVGERRFQPPEPKEKWEGVYDATEFGPMAIQPEEGIMGLIMSQIDAVDVESSEDCLNLNIWSSSTEGKAKPVMVWIHGGAFLNGAGSSEVYDGTSFVDAGDVVIVTLNYRLGVLGFLHLGDIDHEKYSASGNCGILDQIAALQWVKENIAAFGGDPDRVTVFGESAGAMCIGTMLTIPAAEGLFKQVILQSGAANDVHTSESATQVTKDILGNLNMDVDEYDKLVDVPVEQLLEATKDIPLKTLGPVIDGVLIKQHPEIGLKQGVAKEIPILIGTNKDEYVLFSLFDTTWDNLNEEERSKRFQKEIGPAWEDLQEAFPGEALSKSLFEKVMSMQRFTYPAIRLAEAQASHGAPVWMYQFDWESPVFSGGLKASHAMELPFVWDNLDKRGMDLLIGSSPDSNIAKQMQQAWISFAYQGDPNVPNLPKWPRYDKKKRAMMHFDKDSKLMNDANREDRLIWQQQVFTNYF